LNRYIIVVASFMTQKKAVKFIKETKNTSNKKFSIIYDTDVNRYRVVFMVNESKENIWEYKNKTRNEFPGAWILDYDN
jgi:hypothetical protein